MNFIEYQKVLDAKWKQLEKKIKDDEDFKKSGEGKIQVTEEFYITLNTSNLPGLRIFFDKDQKIDEKNLPICKGWKLNSSENTITMLLANERYAEFFKDTINLILTKIYLNKLGKKESINFFLERLNLAKNFYDSENPPKPLSSFSEIGLFGEISLIKDFFLKKYSYKECLAIWTGPNKKHDFTTSKLLLEAKTSTLEDKKIINVSNDQLSPIYDKDLYLCFIQISKDISGITLNDLIETLSLKLNEISDDLLNDFLIKLRQVGYFNFHRDEYDQKYSLKFFNFYEISNVFPHIKGINKPESIFNLSVTYKIDLEKCEDFRINEEQLLNKI